MRARTPRTLVWFRGKDLRVHDHAPLHAALATRGDIVPLFVLDPYFFAPERARAIPHRMQFLLESIAALSASLVRLGTRLLLVEGKSVDVVPRLAHALCVDRVVAQRWCEPFARTRDERVAAALGDVPFELFEGETLLAPGAVRNKSGAPFSVFTPFARAHRSLYGEPSAPLPAPRRVPLLPPDVASAVAKVVAVADVPLPTLASIGIAQNARLLRGGEPAARARMKKFFTARAREYATARDRMDVDGTSRLSQDLHFGLLSPREIWIAAHASLPSKSRALASFTNELLWREFAHHTLWDRPWLLERPFRREFSGFPWRRAPNDLAAWKEGRTGFPIVDAAARQLLGEGFVHNRARMIAASFLTKDLLIDLREGERHYLSFLTDGDWANNDMGWQWSAGCGCDAQPYFRVMNPVTQAVAFDPHGDYVRRWVPELARLDVKYIHAPWTAPKEALAKAGVILGATYPAPIVDHAKARARFLEKAKAHLARRA
jgi:deoxyribodipyrimidine photo-lyase